MSNDNNAHIVLNNYQGESNVSVSGDKHTIADMLLAEMKNNKKLAWAVLIAAKKHKDMKIKKHYLSRAKAIDNGQR